MSESNRLDFLGNVQKYIDEEQSWLQTTLDSLGLSFQYLSHLVKENSQEKDFVCCPIKKEHRMPIESLDAHLTKCEKKYGSYPEITDDFINRISSNFSGIGSHNITDIDEDIINSANKNKKDQQSATAKDLAELLNAERDAKRRRAAHRGKRVHTNKKSYVEILRELIANQMVTLVDDAVNESDDNLKSKVKNNFQESQVKNMLYLGVGEPYSSGNPYTRWMNIEKEEENYLKSLKKTTNDKNDIKKVSSFKPDYYRDEVASKKSSSDCWKYKPRNNYSYKSQVSRKDSSSSNIEKAHSSQFSYIHNRNSHSERSSRDCRNRMSSAGEFQRKVSSRYSDSVSDKSSRKVTDYSRSTKNVKTERDREEKSTDLLSNSSMCDESESEIDSKTKLSKSLSKGKQLVEDRSVNSEKRRKNKKNKKLEKSKKHKRKRCSDSDSI